MSTTSKAKSDHVGYPKPLGTRFDNDTVARMDQVAKALSRKLKTKIKKSNVLEICVANHLPVLEREYGVEAPDARGCDSAQTA